MKGAHPRPARRASKEPEVGPADPAETRRSEAERWLVGRLRAGDAQALGPLFERYADEILGRVIRPRLGDEAAAQDVLKETFLTAFERIEQFEWRRRGIGPWLRQIATNKVRDLHRTRGRRQRLSGVYQDYLGVLGGDQPDAEDRLSWAQQQALARARIEETLGAINPRYARAIRIRLLEGRSRGSCAAELEVTTSTFDVVFFRAVKAFRKHWVTAFVNEEDV